MRTRRGLTGLLAGALLSLSSLAHAEFALPDLGDPAQSTFTPRMGANLGRLVMGELSRAQALVDDIELNDYLQHIAQRLVSGQPDEHIEVHLSLVADAQINAFALPGGYIGIHTGLVQAAHDEAELASVIAHEIGHVRQRHIARILQEQRQLNIGTLAGLLASVALATQNPEAGYGALNAVMASKTQSLINFTRVQEREADQVGIQMLANAGYDPNAMPRFFELLEQRARLAGEFSLEFLRTHPLNAERISMAWQRAQHLSARDTLTAEGDLFQIMQARATVLLFTNQAQGRRWLQQDTQLNTQWPDHVLSYALAFSHLRDGEADLALAYLDDIPATHHHHLWFRLLESQCFIALNDHAKLTDTLSRLQRDYPTHRTVTHLWVDHLLNSQRPQKAERFLKRILQTHPGDAKAHWKLAKLYDEQGRPLQSHLAQAEYRFSLGLWWDALTQLRLAKAMTKSESAQYQAIEQRESEIRQIIKPLGRTSN